jgi:lipopolysaccharide export system protein LptA
MWMTLSRSLPRRREALSRPGRQLLARGALAAVLSTIAMLAATPAPAQKSQASPQASSGPPNALQGFSQNNDQPVKIQADKLEVRDKDKIATFTGHVHVTQGDTEMRSSQLVVFYEDVSKPGAPNAASAKAAPAAASGDQQQIKWIEATGRVHVTQKDQNAEGDKGTFDMRSNVMTLIGNVVVTRGKDVVRGERMVIDLNTGVSRVESASGGQVQSLFQSGAHDPAPPARPR